MKMAKMLMLCTVAVGLLAAPLVGDAVSEKRKAQNKLLAMRAARADAMRKLGERIQGLFISSETHVKDFVTESDTIRTAMAAWLRGMREVGPPKWMEDGTCEVKMEITMQQVIISLKMMHQRYYKGNKFKAVDFEQMTVTNTNKILTVTGMGAPRPEFEDGGEAIAIKEGTSLSSLDYMSKSAKAYWLAHVMPQGRLMAVRAARVVGMRRLAERVKGVFITSNTTVKDFVTESDDINVSMNTFLRGARETAVRYHDAELIVEVDMEVTLASVYASLKSWGEAHYKGDRIRLKKLEELTVTTKKQIIKETGMGVPPEKYLKGVEMSAAMQLSLQTPPWVTQTIRATGNAAIDTTGGQSAAQAKLMAFRGAELDARRKLSEEITGLMITSNTSVKDFVTQNDQIETSMMDFQVGAHVVDGSEKVMEDGTVEAIVEVELRPLWNMIISYQRKLSLQIK
ncbi:MAG TPA: hypothetical protein VNA25_08830 [Phycisphaerae bacterium]|nr:hypothetical protein [Phycisphaerae bacterium]